MRFWRNEIKSRGFTKVITLHVFTIFNGTPSNCCQDFLLRTEECWPAGGTIWRITTVQHFMALHPVVLEEPTDSFIPSGNSAKIICLCATKLLFWVLTNNFHSKWENAYCFGEKQSRYAKENCILFLSNWFIVKVSQITVKHLVLEGKTWTQSEAF